MERVKRGNKTYIHAGWFPVSISRESYCGIVYSLDVDGHNTYFAGGIATHNCPIELFFMDKWKDDYTKSLDADWEDKIDRQAIMDLVETDILQARANGIVAKEGFIMENVAGVSPTTGTPFYRKEKHIALDVKDMVYRRKERLLKAMIATREMKNKLGMRRGDPSTRESDLLERVRKAQDRDVKEVRDADIVEGGKKDNRTP